MRNGLTGCENTFYDPEITNDQESVLSSTLEDCDLLLQCIMEKLESQQRRIVELIRQCHEMEL